MSCCLCKLHGRGQSWVPYSLLFLVSLRRAYPLYIFCICRRLSVSSIQLQMCVSVSAGRLPPLPALRDFIHMYRLRARKILSQNFLMDMNITRKVWNLHGWSSSEEFTGDIIMVCKRLTFKGKGCVQSFGRGFQCGYGFKRIRILINNRLHCIRFRSSVVRVCARAIGCARWARGPAESPGPYLGRAPAGWTLLRWTTGWFRHYRSHTYCLIRGWVVSQVTVPYFPVVRSYDMTVSY